MPRRPLALLTALLVTAGCDESVGLADRMRVSIEEITPPPAMVAGQPATVRVRMVHGACEGDIRIDVERTTADIVTLRASSVPTAEVCIAIAVYSEREVTVIPMTAGPLRIRGIRGEDDRVEVVVPVQ